LRDPVDRRLHAAVVLRETRQVVAVQEGVRHRAVALEDERSVGRGVEARVLAVAGEVDGAAVVSADDLLLRVRVRPLARLAGRLVLLAVLAAREEGERLLE